MEILICCVLYVRLFMSRSNFFMFFSVLSSKWVPGGPGDVPHQERRFLHPEGPQLGKFWNKQSCVAFDKLKLTNSRKSSQRDQVAFNLYMAIMQYILS